MMYRASQLYNFMRYCESQPLEKNILECGAGISAGFTPLLLRFHQAGYLTQGIENSTSQLSNAANYCCDNNVDLKIVEGDARNIIFPDVSFSFAFSYNSIFHMPKKDIQIAIYEIERILRPGGLCYINFLSVDDDEYAQGMKCNEGEYVQNCHIMGETIHSFFKDNEPEQFFQNTQIIFKEKRSVTRFNNTSISKQGSLDYIIKKV